jgi:hypothetical protein
MAASLLTNRDEMSNFIEDLPYMLSIKFQLIWESGFRGEDFLEINKSEKRMACGGHVCCSFSYDPLTNTTATDHSCF